MHSKFEVLFMEQARSFLLELDKKAREKIIYNIEKAKILNEPDLLKKLQNDIWEFRTRYNGLQYRLLAFWDKGDAQNTVIISTHGFVKKSEKIPQAEIDRANRLKELYFAQKK